jgi:hypothetical protein
MGDRVSDHRAPRISERVTASLFGFGRSVVISYGLNFARRDVGWLAA